MGIENKTPGQYGVIIGGANRTVNGPMEQMYPNAPGQQPNNLQKLINALLDNFPATNFQRVDINLAAGLVDQPVYVAGTAVRFGYASISTALLYVSLDRVSNPNGGIPLAPGNSIEDTTFNRLYLNAAAQNTVATLIIWTDTPAARVILR